MRSAGLHDRVFPFTGRAAVSGAARGKTQNRNAPPDVITVGDLPERLYRPQKPFADELTQRLAWKQALGHLPEELVKQVLPLPPEESDVEAWLAIGELLAKLHRELAAEHLRFSDVLERAREFPNFTEIPRWEALSQIQVEYLKIPDDLHLWDQQTARLVAIEQQECQTRKQIVLVGAVDMNQTLREMLDQVADHVTVYVHAPSDLVRLFDSHGCLIPKPLGRPANRPLARADDPGREARRSARAVARQLDALNGSRRVGRDHHRHRRRHAGPVTQRILSQPASRRGGLPGQLFCDTPLAHCSVIWSTIWRSGGPHSLRRSFGIRTFRPGWSIREPTPTG